MSRSRRKVPIAGISKAESDKQDKQLANRRHRRMSKLAVTEDKEMPHKRAVSDVWGMAKDGKRWYGSSKKYSDKEFCEKIKRK